MGNCFGEVDRALIPRDEPVDTTPLRNSRGIIIFVVGGPGVGKSTLCAKLAAKYQLVLISVSDTLRDEVVKGTEKGQRFREIMERGLNLPADVIVQLVARQMLNEPNAFGYLVNGFPRDKKQAMMFNEEIRPPTLLINLYARYKILQRRMRERTTVDLRFDDNPEAISNRVKMYYTRIWSATRPNRAVTRIIDAERNADEVLEEACRIVDEVLRQESEKGS